MGRLANRWARALSAAAVIVALALAGPSLAARRKPAAAVQPPCTTATEACAAWVKLGPAGARAMIYTSYPLTRPNPRIRRALIMVHGTLRNADRYFTTATGAGFIAGALGDTIIIAPAIRSSADTCKDVLQPQEVSWSCRGDTWRSGGAAASDPALTSFDFVDEILRRLADRHVFPKMQAIVVAGHSAGGQFVHRYEMANRVHETLGVPVTYVVANPSSYAWPDATRPLPVDSAAPAVAALAWNSEDVHTKFSYGPFNAAKAPDFNAWPYGLEKHTTGYAARLTDDQLRAQLAARPTTYVFGQVDTLPLGGFDDSPRAMAQGATRRARGEAFVKYIADQLGAKPKVLIAPECGHNDRCIFTTDAVLPAIFPPL